MSMNEKKICQVCGEKANYREKQGEIYCQKHHQEINLKSKGGSYKTYTGDD